MSRSIIVILLVGLSSPGIPAQTAAPAGRGGTVSQIHTRQDTGERFVLRLEDEWAAALVRRDTTTFRRLLADGFLYTEDDRTSTRDALLREFLTGNDTVEAANNEDTRFHSFGTTSIVTGWRIIRGKEATGPFDRRYRFTDTWALILGRWQMVAAHDYLVPKGR